MFLAVCRGAEGAHNLILLCGSVQTATGMEVHRKAEEAKDVCGSRHVASHCRFREWEPGVTKYRSSRERKYSMPCSCLDQWRLVQVQKMQTMRCHEVSLGNSCARHLRL